MKQYYHALRLFYCVLLLIGVMSLHVPAEEPQTTDISPNALAEEVQQLKREVRQLQERVRILETQLSAETPEQILLRASKQGKIELVQNMLGQDVDINIQDHQGRTPLRLASEFGHTEIVKLLLDHGADVSIKDQQGTTALLTAIEHSHKEIAQLLSEKIDLLLSGESEEPSQQIAQKSETSEQAETETSPPPSSSGRPSEAQLLQAAAEGNLEAVKVLLEQGIDVNAKTDTGYTALMLAAGGGSGAVVVELLDKGINVNATTDKGYTALMFAAEGDYVEIVKLLLNGGADISLKTEAGQIALDFAKERKNKEVARLLENAEFAVGPNQYRVVVKRDYSSAVSQDLSPVWRAKARDMCNGKDYDRISYEYKNPGSDMEEIIGVIECRD